MKFGIVDNVFYDEYLSDYVCPACKQNFSTKLVMYCKAFATGITWWAWKKQGYVECTGCGTVSELHTLPQAKGIRSSFSLKSLPVRYFLPSVLVGSLLIIMLLGGAMYAIRKVTYTNRDGFTGMWVGQGSNAALYVLDDDRYTYVSNDTIIFGRYEFDRKADHIRVSIQGQPNEIAALEDGRGIQLHVAPYEYVSFTKMSHGLGYGHPFGKENNGWRIKARHSETKAAIKQRILAYLHYLEARYQWALNNRLSYLPAEAYSPIMMAGNGIAMTDESLRKWRPVFYSDADWQAAAEFMNRTFPDQMTYNVKEPNAYIRNLECIRVYIRNVENTDINVRPDARL